MIITMKWRWYENGSLQLYRLRICSLLPHDYVVAPWKNGEKEGRRPDKYQPTVCLNHRHQLQESSRSNIVQCMGRSPIPVDPEVAYHQPSYNNRLKHCFAIRPLFAWRQWSMLWLLVVHHVDNITREFPLFSSPFSVPLRSVQGFTWKWLSTLPTH